MKNITEMLRGEENMRKQSSILKVCLLRILVIGMILGFLGAGTVSVSAATPKVQRIRWSGMSSKKSMYAKTSKKFKVKITPSRAKKRALKWKSSNKKVATVSSSGIVKALRPGKATITCYVKSQKYRKVTCRVTVKRKKVTSVKFSSGTPVVQKGKTYRKSPSVSPSYAYDRRVTYKSSNTKVATVSSSGTVTGKAEGYATITATAKDGSKKKGSYKIRVIGNITNKSSKFVAHRGLSSEAPENTVKAYELAGAAGFWGAEADVRMTKDGKFILMHDATLKRMCGKDVRPEDLTLAEIQKMPIIAGNNIAKYRNTSTANTVATLEDYLETCIEYNMVPVIEIKMEYVEYGDTQNNRSMQRMTTDNMEDLYDATKKVMGNRQYMFIAYDFYTMERMNDVLRVEKLPNVSLQHVTNNPDQGMKNYYKNEKIELDANYTKITSSEIQAFKNAGIPVNLWTVDDQGKVWDYIKMKADYITTNKRFW